MFTFSDSEENEGNCSKIKIICLGRNIISMHLMDVQLFSFGLNTVAFFNSRGERERERGEGRENERVGRCENRRIRRRRRGYTIVSLKV